MRTRVKAPNAHQGEGAKPAEHRDDSEGYGILISSRGAREKRPDKKEGARLAEEARAQKRKENAARKAA